MKIGNQIKFFTLLSLCFAFVLVASAADTKATNLKGNSLDGVEFQPVPINIKQKCSSIILKGTNKFQGYAFKMPRVLVSINRYMENLFEILPLDGGKYLLRFALYFPLTDEAYNLRLGQSELFELGCDDNAILEELNRNLQKNLPQKSPSFWDKILGKTPQQSESPDAVHTLTNLPISSVEVRVNGIDNPYIIGQAETSIMHYQGLDKVAEFVIPNAESLQQIIARLTGKIGLSIDVKMNFSARSSNGRLYVDVDASSIARNIEAGLAGKIDPANVAIGDADLQAYFSSQIASSNINIQSEDSDSDAFNKAAAQLLSKIVNSVPALQKNPDQVYNPFNENLAPRRNNNINGGNWDPRYSTPDDSTDSTSTDDPFSNNNNSNNNNRNRGFNRGIMGSRFANNSVTDNTGSNTNTGTGNANSGSDGNFPRRPVVTPPADNTKFFNLGLVIKNLKQQGKVSLKWENLGKLENQSYSTSVIVHGIVSDMGYKTMNVIAQNKQGETFYKTINKGSQVNIKIPSHRQLLTYYKKTTTYFSTYDIKNRELIDYFNILDQAKLSLEDVATPEYGTVAVYSAIKCLGYLCPKVKYYWGMMELKPNVYMGDAEDFTLEDQDISKIPLQIIFSNFGSRFPLEALTKSTEKWDGKIVDGMISFVAKEDLGQMTIRSLEPVTDQVQPAKYLFQVMEEEGSSSPTRTITYVKPEEIGVSDAQVVENPMLKDALAKQGVYVLQLQIKQETDAKQGTPSGALNVQPFSNPNDSMEISPVIIPGPLR